jgi:hypothetical protein
MMQSNRSNIEDLRARAGSWLASTGPPRLDSRGTPVLRVIAACRNQQGASAGAPLQLHWGRRHDRWPDESRELAICPIFWNLINLPSTPQPGFSYPASLQILKVNPIPRSPSSPILTTSRHTLRTQSRPAKPPLLPGLAVASPFPHHPHTSPQWYARHVSDPQSAVD